MRILKFILFFLILFLAVLYGIFYLFSIKKYNVDFGISFNRQHAASLGLDWKKVYFSMLHELEPKFVRIAANWSEVESEQGKFDFSDIDWQFAEAAKKGTKIVLVIGQKAPRWPECHIPTWAVGLNSNIYRQELFAYLGTVVDKYKNNETLEMWQVENEPFINFKFGECNSFRRDLVSDEVAFVKNIDQNHKIVITDSGELSTWSQASKLGDIFGTTIYRIVRTPGGYYFNYDWLPAGFYKLKAWFWGRGESSFIVSELQAEPWFTNTTPATTPIAEQEKSMNPERLQKHMDYVEHLGVARSYLWGVEWWYWMKEVNNDNSYWNLVKDRISGVAK